MLAAPRLALGHVYVATFVIWLLTRIFITLYQGTWPWMNFFVVETARGMLAGTWDEAFRPLLPSLLAMPLLAAGLSEQTIVTSLYLAASACQFGAFVALIRNLYPGLTREQGLALLLFLLAPMNHSIHHWRNTPVILATCAIFLLGAHALRMWRRSDAWSGTWMASLWATGAIFVGVWTRSEALVFVGTLLLLAWLTRRPERRRMTALYLGAAFFAVIAQQGAMRLAGADPTMSARYQVHTFLDSTPASWLTDECRLYPTENCREDDGWQYFGPEDRAAPLWRLILDHPWTTIHKTLQSALDNVWVLFGASASTYPGWVWLIAAAGLLSSEVRGALRRVPVGHWIMAAAALAVTVLPPLSWAPPHPQYHLPSLIPMVVLAVPVGVVLSGLRRVEWLVVLFLIGNAALGAVRYTRYPGY